MDAVIISVGTELTAGQSVDTNSAWLSAELTRLGIRVVGHVTVGDDVDRIRTAIKQALDEPRIVVLTGGLGPTPDDLTRNALAEAIGEPLEQNPEALGQVRAFFERWQRPMPESNKVQAMIPRGCDVIPNERGTAPGIWYHRGEAHLFALPGVPAEMKAMFSRAVTPVVEGKAGGARTQEIRLLCHGISEAKIGELLGDLMGRERNPLVGTTASAAIISVRVLATGAGAGEAKRLAEADAAEIRRRLGHAVFGSAGDSLAGAVGRLLQQGGWTVATAESCTGGLVAKRLTDIPGSSAYFLRGYVTYSNESKEQLLDIPSQLIAAKGAVSDEVARAMASGCRTVAGSDFALSVTGIAGPGGGCPPEKPVGLVHLGMAHAGGVETRRVLCGAHLSREEIRDRSCKAALNLLRLHLLRAEVA